MAIVGRVEVRRKAGPDRSSGVPGGKSEVQTEGVGGLASGWGDALSEAANAAWIAA
jgi:hypothetical protein